MSQIRTRSRRARLAPRIVAPAVLLALLLAGCSGAGSTSTDSAPESGGRSADQPVAAPGSDIATYADPSTSKEAADTAATDRSIVRTASLTVQSDAVRPAVDRARSIAAAAGGSVASEQTTVDPANPDLSQSLLVLRVPADRLDAVLVDLAALGELRDQSQSAQDVTVEVVDLEARIATQRASIERVRALLARAETIGDIVTLESELTRREADLEAMLARQQALADQVAQSSITLSLLGPDAAPATEDTGFLAGLRAGWDAFTAATTAVLTGVGAVLPFLALALLVGLPLAAWWRRRGAPIAPAAPAEDEHVPAPVG